MFIALFIAFLNRASLNINGFPFCIQFLLRNNNEKGRLSSLVLEGKLIEVKYIGKKTDACKISRQI